MHRFFFSKKALTRIRFAVIAAIVVIAVFASAVYYARAIDVVDRV